jgi:hypothetical protein
MTSVLIQLVCALIAGAALFLVCRNVARQDRTFGLILALGLLGRSILGQFLFWISYLDMVARGAHFGNGFWFFGSDGYWYMLKAVESARRGPAAILALSQERTAGTYLELLATFVVLFGGAASIAILLNLFCYAGTAWLITRFSRSTPEARTPALFALIAITFYPAGVLWSSQPLKDPLIHFLLVVLAGSAILWQRAWRDDGRPLWIVVAFAGISIAIYGITGSRWYLGLGVLGAVSVFVLLVLFTVRRRRLALFGASLLLVVTMTALFLEAGGEAVPRPMRAAMTLRLNALHFGRTMVAYTEGTRTKFGHARGSTEIRVVKGSSRILRLTAGVAAVLLPNFVIRQLDFMEIGGGRGLLWFADVDTIVFIAVAAASIVLAVRRWRLSSLSNPLFWLVALSTLFVALPLLYAVTNFGALLRFRGMIFIPLTLLPLAVVIGTPSPALRGARDETGEERR